MRISGKKSRRPLQGEIQKKEWVKRIRKEKMRMKKLFDYAAKYLERSDWKDLAMIKLCLFSIGILAGMRIPQKNRVRCCGCFCSHLYSADGKICCGRYG